MPTKSLLHTNYDRLVQGGSIRNDDAQRAVLAVLQRLTDQLAGHEPRKRISRLFSRQAASSGLSGVYIWGNVGRGKSMLMELFFTAAPVEQKRRVHFHAFMQEVHAGIHTIRKGGGGDPVAMLAQKIAAETRLLCFDELQATDVADATLLFRLFSGLFEAGVIIVSTSNHPPASLYTGGIQRERFDKFVALLEKKMEVVSLSSPKDYRLTQIRSLQRTYVWPLSKDADAFISDAMSHICPGAKPKKATLTVQGRTLHYQQYDDSIGRFSFSELCETTLGPADYLAIADTLDTVILTEIPKLGTEKRNEAKRFVTLIDALYEHKVKLLCTAAVPPEKIYPEGDGAFEFQRTVSRLMEMQSAQWMNG